MGQECISEFGSRLQGFDEPRIQLDQPQRQVAAAGLEYESCSSEPDDRVLQSVRSRKPIRDNDILSRLIKPAGRELGLPRVNWLNPAHLACCLFEVGRSRPEGRTGTDETLAHQYDGHLHPICS